MKQALGAFILFSFPLLAGAAGFAKDTIFLSTNSPVEGQTILIHASVSNPTTSKFTGKLEVHDELGAIGNAAVSLEAGAADDISVQWKPKAGAHTVVATLKDNAGAAVEESSQTFSIAAKTPPAGASAASAGAAGVQSSQQIQNSIGSISPETQKYSAPVFTMIDSGRVFAAKELQKGIDWSKKQAGVSKVSPGSGAFVSNDESSAGKTAWSVLGTVSLYILTVLLYIVTNAGIFYPVLAVLFLYFLWKMFRRYRR